MDSKDIIKFYDNARKAYEKVWMFENSLTIRTQRILETESFKMFHKDSLSCLEGWQFYEPGSMLFEDRFEQDKVAYQEEFFNSVHKHIAKYDESKLIKKLINNLQKAKHPYFIDYRGFLQKLNIRKDPMALSQEDVALILFTQTKQQVTRELCLKISGDLGWTTKSDSLYNKWWTISKDKKKQANPTRLTKIKSLGPHFKSKSKDLERLMK